MLGAKKAVDEEPADDIRSALAKPGFTPKREHAPRLVLLLGDPEETIAAAAERALERMGTPAARAGIERFLELPLGARVRLVAVVGRLARTSGDLLPWLRERTGDPESRVRRRAFRAL